MANTTIQVKRSGTPSAVPSALNFGELALNYADGLLFYKNATSQIVSISSGGFNFGTINANGTMVVADTAGDVLNLVAGTNVTFTVDTVTDSITINASGGSGDVSAPFNAANAAFAKANSALANTSGVTFAGDLTITGNVSVGTLTTPSDKFQIGGTGSIDFSGRVDSATAGDRPSFRFIHTGGGLTTASPTDARLGLLSFAGVSAGGSLTTYAYLDSFLEGSPNANANAYIKIHTMSNGQATERMRIASNGNIGIGTSTPNYLLEVAGSFAAQTKSFVINHPTKPDKKLRYGSLEGPENGVYYRGRCSETVIKLPDYWEGLVDAESVTVHITPMEGTVSPKVRCVNNKKIVLKKPWFGNLDYFFIIFGERKDVEKLRVEF